MTGDRKNGVTNVKFKRPLQTNEPVNDRAIPTDREVSIIAAIGPLNSRQEANAHSHNGMDVNADDIQINFSSKVCFFAFFTYVYLIKLIMKVKNFQEQKW